MMFKDIELANPIFMDSFINSNDYFMGIYIKI